MTYESAVPEVGPGAATIPGVPQLNPIQLSSAFAALNSALRSFRCSLDAFVAPMGVVLNVVLLLESDRIPGGVLLRYAELEVAEAFDLPNNWLVQLGSLFPPGIYEADHETWESWLLEGSNITLRACSTRAFARLRRVEVTFGPPLGSNLKFAEHELGGSHWAARKFKSVADIRSAYPNLPELAGIAHHREHLREDHDL